MRFFDEVAAESGVPADDPEAAALCMNFIVKSLEETPLGVSGAMVAVVIVLVSYNVSGFDRCNCAEGSRLVATSDHCVGMKCQGIEKRVAPKVMFRCFDLFTLVLVGPGPPPTAEARAKHRSTGMKHSKPTSSSQPSPIPTRPIDSIVAQSPSTWPHHSLGP